MATRVLAHRVRRLEQGVGGDASTLQGHPASYFATALMPVYNSSPPAASASYRGMLIIVRDNTNNIDQVMTCLFNSAFGYEWVVLQQSS